MTHTRSITEPLGDSLADARANVGGKAANLGVMARDLGLPVPPAFVITTATCRTFLAEGWPDGLDAELRARMAELEDAVERRFGDPSDPLLVSVRSGAPVSMPGMMDTILNLGLNDATTAGLARATGDEAFARSCRARLEASFRDIVGVDAVPDDSWAQLRLAIEAVFRSWDSERAIAYRRKEGIADDIGTAVTVQAMVFGNRGDTSATGVLFTRDPATGEARMYGDVLFDAQGEDVVAGTHRTESIDALDTRLPAIAAELREAATRLERHYADLCDIEFTIEQGRLWMLQVRVGKRSPQAALRIAVDMAEDPEFPLTRAEAVARVAPLLADPPKMATSRAVVGPRLLTGLPASPGVASGEIATSADAAQAAAEAGRTPILVRADTSPDDVHGMARSAGILTARGGLASHAAVVARGWGIPAVVGAEGLEVRDGEVRIGERVLRAGAVITIDGATGEVFEGAVAGTTEVVPEARTLLAWAEELGIGIPGPAADVADTPASPASALATGAVTSTDGGVTPDDCIRALGVKGFATTEAIADACRCTPDAVTTAMERCTADGLVATTAGAFRLTDDGKVRAADLMTADREAWGTDAATAALDAFLDLDHRVKDIVTAWQMRDEATVNDHTDPDYDAGVLDRLAATHADAMAWLAPLQDHVARFADYGARLGSALDAARAGDGHYVASPRVDSYHGIWFELHENLIQLAGRTREEESAAGRA